MEERIPTLVVLAGLCLALAVGVAFEGEPPMPHRDSSLTVMLTVTRLGIGAISRVAERALAWTTSHLSADGLSMWWSGQMALTRPAVSFKLFVASLLAVDLLGIAVAEQDTLAAPELVDLMRDQPGRSGTRPPLTEVLVPTLAPETAAEWYARLSCVRVALVASWVVFLLVPAAYTRTAAASYSAGAGLYAYLVGIALDYTGGHQTPQVVAMFVLLAATAVPGLATNERAGSWLRQMLISAVLVPTYLLSGVDKLRVHGVIANLDGEWLQKAAHARPSTWLRPSEPTLAAFSCGNLFLEVALPVVVLFSAQGRAATACRVLVCALSLAFYVAFVVLLGSHGPDPVHMSPLLILALDPLSCSCRKAFEPEIQEARRITSLSTRSTSHEILMEAVVATTEPLPLHILPLPPDADVPRSAADRGRAVLASAVFAVRLGWPLWTDFRSVAGWSVASGQAAAFWLDNEGPILPISSGGDSLHLSLSLLLLGTTLVAFAAKVRHEVQTAHCSPHGSPHGHRGPREHDMQTSATTKLLAAETHDEWQDVGRSPGNSSGR